MTTVSFPSMLLSLPPTPLLDGATHQRERVPRVQKNKSRAHSTHLGVTQNTKLRATTYVQRTW